MRDPDGIRGVAPPASGYRVALQPLSWRPVYVAGRGGHPHEGWREPSTLWLHVAVVGLFDGGIGHVALLPRLAPGQTPEAFAGAAMEALAPLLRARAGAPAAGRPRA